MCSIALNIKGGMKITSSLECTRVGNTRLLTTKEIAQICAIKFPFQIGFLFTQITLNLNQMTKTYNFVNTSIQQSQ